MASSEWELQVEIYDAIRNDATVQGLIGSTARVYDHVPQDPTFPYVTIGEGTTIDESTFAKNGFEHTLEIHSWSRYRGRKEVSDIMSAVHGALHEVTLTPATFVHVGIVFEFSQSLLEPDGLTRHGVQRFRAILMEA